MKINSRVQLKEFILSIERDFDVNSWKIKDLHLWPVLRIAIYIPILKQITNEYGTNTKIRDHQYLKMLSDLLFGFTEFKKLDNQDYVFISEKNFEVNLEGESVNKFFYPMIESNQLEGKFVYIDSQSDKSDNNKLNYVTINNYGTLFSKIKNKLFKNKNLSLEKVDELCDYLQTSCRESNISHFFKTENDVQEYVLNFYSEYEYALKVLKTIKPKKVYVLCYYNKLRMALTAAANTLEIKTYEMQHGPQADLHMAYSHWDNVPQQGYNTLPKNFLNWDEGSRQNLLKWQSKQSYHTSTVIGNPWIDFWLDKIDHKSNKQYILYSLQPLDNLELMIPSALLDFIEQNDYKWLFRLHPRNKSEIPSIRSYIEKRCNLEKIEIERATNEPLPKLLAESYLHVTQFSGTAIEAEMFDIYTVFLHDYAKNMYHNIIKNDDAIFVDINDDAFKDVLKEIIENNHHKNLKHSSSNGS